MQATPYDEIADWYDEIAGAISNDATLSPFLKIIGDAAGQRVCDLACGQGILSRALARRGSRVVGIDLSLRMLGIARRYERDEPRGVAYLHGDAQALTAVRDESFDGVICHLALMDIPDLDAALRTVQRILRTGGWFAFSIVHPCFQTPGSEWLVHSDGRACRGVSGYCAERFWRSENLAGVRGKVGAHHRMLSTYLNALVAAGLPIERAAEPPETGERGRLHPGNREVPWLFFGRCRKRQ